jgi:phosphatidylserine/phosphatidylglycerophosphate/cardiolipin synthase-like enzyme
VDKKKPMLTPINPPLEGTVATVLLTVSPMPTRRTIKLEFHEASPEREGDKGEDQVIGTLDGASAPADKHGTTVSFDEAKGVGQGVPQPSAGDKSKKRVVAVIVPKKGGKDYGRVFFALPEDRDGERRSYFLYAKMLAPDKSESNRIPLGRNAHALDVGKEATYDWHAHNRVDLFVHGHEKEPSADHKSAFDEMIKAIKEAKHFIFITDWSFQPHFRVVRKKANASATIGKLLIDRAAEKEPVLVGILAWRHVHEGNAAAPDEQNNAGKERLRALNGGGRLPKHLLWRIAFNTPTYSHHQKFVVLDAPDLTRGSSRRLIKVFFGGLDLTKGRYDWHEHVFDPQVEPIWPSGLRAFPATRPTYKPNARGPEAAAVRDFKAKVGAPLEGKNEHYEYDDWYSAEFQDDTARRSDLETPKQPWHDIHACLTGPAAWDFVKEWVGRWNEGHFEDRGDKGSEETKMVNDLYAVTLHDRSKFFQQNEEPPTARDDGTEFRWTAQVVRSMKRSMWGGNASNQIKGFEPDFRWTLAESHERSIQDAYVRAIQLAEEYIYIETQYFISSGNSWQTTSWGVKNELAKEICDKIEERKGKGKKFHCYIICPMWPEGPPLQSISKVPQNQRFFEWQTMQYIMTRLQDWWTYVSFYFLGKNGPIRSRPPGEEISKHSYVGLASTFGRLRDKDGYDRRLMVQLNNRYMVYVHSKLMIVDDKYLIVGSANLNERSLAGDRDTEICVQIWPKFHKHKKACKDQLKEFRKHLFKEHFGDDSGDPKTWGGSAQEIAKANYWMYRCGQIVTKGQAMMLPFRWGGEDGKQLRVEEDTSLAEGSNELLPDAEENDDEWRWWSTKKWLTSWIDLAE